ncbi:MAG TPA: M28 family peptidase [Terriglobales bacterium]|jgi:Zn-dependent M28 family amino/carboxypeptidase|nr:M28 family peptidase [Terriglobales bacterium]
MHHRACLLLISILVLVSPIALMAQTAKPLAANIPANLNKTTAKKTAVVGAHTGLPAGVVATMDAISGDRIREHIRFLSHDLLEGRGTGARGGDIAGQYIATQFALLGLEPAGDDGTFLQKVPMVGLTAQPDTKFAIVHDGQEVELKAGDEYVATDETQNASSDIDADIVFVGYGIEAPEYKWNDYKDVDLKGKVLMMVVNEPPSDDPNFFKGKALTYYGRWTYKFEEAARKGAVAVLLVHKEGFDPYGWDVVRNSWSGEQSRLRGEEGPKLKAAARIHESVARKIAAMAGGDFDDWLKQIASPDFRPIPIPLRLKAHMVTKVRPFESNNVIGKISGSDPRKKDEAVMYTAHYDHLGIHPDQPGDNIYNGAMDNASGCGIIMEIARAFATAPQRPARSILIVSVTAEEQGLLGSQYFGEHPPIPAGKIALDLNYDDVPARGVPEETEVVGSERTNFYPVVQQTAQEFGLTIIPDSHPDAGHYYRSDHFSLARVGIPSFSINEGMKYQGHTREWGMEQADYFTKNIYHHPSDELRPDMDFHGDAIMARFGFALGWKAANLPQLPQWQHGDEFEAARLQGH